MPPEQKPFWLHQFVHKALANMQKSLYSGHINSPANALIVLETPYYVSEHVTEYSPTVNVTYLLKISHVCL